MTRHLITLTISLLALGSAFAQSNDEEKPRKERRGPPEVAFEACASSVEGDVCTFEGRRGENVEGLCESREDKPLVCVPEGGPPDHRLQRS